MRRTGPRPALASVVRHPAVAGGKRDDRQPGCGTAAAGDASPTSTREKTAVSKAVVVVGRHRRGRRRTGPRSAAERGARGMEDAVLGGHREVDRVADLVEAHAPGARPWTGSPSSSPSCGVAELQRREAVAVARHVDVGRAGVRFWRMTRQALRCGCALAPTKAMSAAIETSPETFFQTIVHVVLGLNHMFAPLEATVYVPRPRQRRRCPGRLTACRRRLAGEDAELAGLRQGAGREERQRGA
jgi:hypothetical protein